MQVELVAPAASVTRKRAAAAVDAALVLLLALAALYAGYRVFGTSGSDSEWISYLVAFLVFDLPPAYALVMAVGGRKGARNGQTIGGRLTRTRRVRDDGRPITVGDALFVSGRLVDAVETIPLAGEVFMSYSRHDLYFAEHLTRRLTDRHADVWIDVARLGPGVDWEAGIDAAVDRAAAVVLVASPAAMASPHVGREWRRAAAAGTPVHVALATRTKLPPEPPAASVTDLRGRFEAGVDRLGEALAGRPDATAPRRRLPLPRRPVAVWVAAAYLTVIALSLVALGVGGTWAVLADDLDGERAARHLLACSAGWWLVFTAVAWWAWWGLLSRRFHPSWLTMWALMAPIIPTLLIVSSLEEAAQQLPGASLSEYAGSSVSDVADVWGFTLLLFVAGIGVSMLFYSSAGMFRWSPTRTVDPRQRRAHGLPPAAADASADALPARAVSLHCDGPADEGPLAAIAKRLGASPHVAAREHEADTHIVVVSSDTRRDWLDDLIARRRGDLLCVFATSVRLPGSLGAVGQWQWVDFRRRMDATADGIVQSIATRTVAAPLLPERLDRIIVPGSVTLLAGWMLIVAAMAIGSGVAAVAPIGGLSALDGTLQLGAGAAFAWLAMALRDRRVTRSTLAACAIGAGALLALGGGVPIVGLMFPFLSGTSVPADVWIWAAVSAWLAVAAYKDVASWLPAQRRARTHGVLGLPAGSRTTIIAAALGAVLVAAVLVAGATA